MKRFLVLLLLPILLGCGDSKSESSAGNADIQIVETLLRNTVRYYDLLRHDNGLYHDFVPLNGTETNRGSSANVGMGLVAQCIGVEMGWKVSAEAEAEVIETLEAVLGVEGSPIKLARNEANCFVHFFDLTTGQMTGDTWSPIDTDLMIGGALFAKRYFGENKTIAKYADELYAMVDHTNFVGDPALGHVSLSMEDDGSASGKWTLPYNEYMIVAWFAKCKSEDPNSDANKLWNQWYGTPENLPLATYVTKDGESYSVPTDHAKTKDFTSNFTFMFNYLFVNEFTESPAYLDAMRRAAYADRAWWNERDDLKAKGLQSYEWGTTAGAGLRERDGELVEGYTVDKICAREHIGTSRDKNRYLNVAPSAMIGYSPVLPDLVRRDLLALYRDPRGVGKLVLPKREGITSHRDTVLWKYSYSDISWKPTKIEGVDYACMLLGLAALPEMLGVDFFKEYNDFFSDQAPNYSRR